MLVTLVMYTAASPDRSLCLALLNVTEELWGEERDLQDKQMSTLRVRLGSQLVTGGYCCCGQD